MYKIKAIILNNLRTKLKAIPVWNAPTGVGKTRNPFYRNLWTPVWSKDSSFRTTKTVAKISKSVDRGISSSEHTTQSLPGAGKTRNPFYRNLWTPGWSKDSSFRTTKTVAKISKFVDRGISSSEHTTQSLPGAGKTRNPFYRNLWTPGWSKDSSFRNTKIVPRISKFLDRGISNSEHTIQSLPAAADLYNNLQGWKMKTRNTEADEGKFDVIIFTRDSTAVINYPTISSDPPGQPIKRAKKRPSNYEDELSLCRTTLKHFDTSKNNVSATTINRAKPSQQPLKRLRKRRKAEMEEEFLSLTANNSKDRFNYVLKKYKKSTELCEEVPIVPDLGIEGILEVSDKTPNANFVPTVSDNDTSDLYSVKSEINLISLPMVSETQNIRRIIDSETVAKVDGMSLKPETDTDINDLPMDPETVSTFAVNSGISDATGRELNYETLILYGLNSDATPDAYLPAVERERRKAHESFKEGAVFYTIRNISSAPWVIQEAFYNHLTASRFDLHLDWINKNGRSGNEKGILVRLRELPKSVESKTCETPLTKTNSANDNDSSNFKFLEQTWQWTKTAAGQISGWSGSAGNYIKETWDSTRQGLKNML